MERAAAVEELEVEWAGCLAVYLSGGGGLHCHAADGRLQDSVEEGFQCGFPGLSLHFGVYEVMLMLAKSP